MNDVEKFGRRLRRTRQNQHYTQESLAREVYVCDATISRYERGLTMPDKRMLWLLAEALNVSVDYLLGLENKED